MKKCTSCKSTETCKWYKGPICSQCYRKNLYIGNREEKLSYQKNRYEQNKEIKLKYQKEYYSLNKEDRLLYEKNRYEQNKEERLKYQKEYYKANKKKVLEYQNKYEARKMKTDIAFMLKKRVRARLKVAMRGDYKTGLALEFLGCSILELKLHLESLFKPNMTWDNYGKEWEIDHKMPLFKFDLSKSEDLTKVCHYTNLQPLFKNEHYKKSHLDRRKK